MNRFVSCLLMIGPALSALPTGPEHGTLLREATLYVMPGPTAQKLMRVERGVNMVVLEKTSMDNTQWLKVFVSIPLNDETQREVAGWLPAKGVVTTSAPDGDQIIFGEAVDSESQAEQRGGRKGAAQDALRLYHRAAELFPNSPLAAEALWRSADIRWRLAKDDLMSKPSYRELDSEARPPLDERFMKEIIKKFPQTKWADLAAYVMIDNKLCGEWKGLANCPEKETDLYELYVKEHPHSPKAAQALYNAAWRQAALVDIYRVGGEEAKSSDARKRAIGLTQEIAKQYPEAGDLRSRSLDLAYKLEHGVAVYGSSPD